MSEATAGSNPGRLIVVCGCMFAGKTTRLIDQLVAAHLAGRRVLACKHHFDDRYDPAQLATHDRRRFQAVALETATEVLAEAATAEVIGIDEGHFFGRKLVGVCENLVARGCEVWVAGIDHDAWGQPFPPFPELKTIADEVEVLQIPCTVCRAPARYSQRLHPVTDGYMVGGPGDYEPRCAAHFQPLPPPAPEYT
ncbi:MAG: thymidine kinase [Phycisphaerales bacterium]|nr:thymidine kinase [Phycisphaerales bacterium]